jgi:hypothetical protein
MDAIRTAVFSPFARASVVAAAAAVWLLGINSLNVSAATAIGSATGNMGCASGMDTVQLSTSGATSFTVPTGASTITGWSTLAGADIGPAALLVWRPTATAGTFTLVGESPLMTLTPNVLNSFALTTPIAVQPLDVIGLRVDGRAECIQQPGAASDVIGYRVGATPAVGGTEAFLTDPLNLTLDVSATVGTATTPPPPPPSTGCDPKSKDTNDDCAGPGGSRSDDHPGVGAGGDKSAGDKSAGDKSTGDKSVRDKSAGDRPARDMSAGHKSSGDKSTHNGSAHDRSTRDL